MRPFGFCSIFSIGVFCGLLIAGAVADPPPVSSDPAGGGCHIDCDYCWCGTQYENNCDPMWFYDDECDCGCQFCDAWCYDCEMQDCRGSGSTGACCCPDLTCSSGVTQANCLSAGCAYQGDGSSCVSGCPCDNMPLPCDWCWVGTPNENNCPTDWYGANDGCDCGCQWVDPDCGGSPVGACCGPLQPIPECIENAEQQACLEAGGAYMGDGTSCAAANCGSRCAPECMWCWTGTLAENNCDPEWEGDGECDCD